MKLHNNFKIYKNDRCVAEGLNQMFSSVLDAIESYTGFAKYLAVGGKMGTTESELSDDTLTNALGVFRVYDEEFQLNPLLGTMYARRKITIPNGVLSGAEIGAVGFCSLPDGVVDDGESDQICQTATVELYNYATLKNSLGNSINISKGTGSIEIYSTVYLEWDTSVGVLPLGGDNKFLKFLLGTDSYAGTTPTFDFGVGMDTRPNTKQVEFDYLFTKRYVTQGAVPTVSKTDSAIEFLFASSSVNAIPTSEIVLAVNDEPAIRQNRMRIMTTSEATETVTTSEYGVGTIQSVCSGDIVRVVKKSNNEVLMETEDELATLKTESYPCLIPEPRPYPFGEGKDYCSASGWTPYESRCGNMLAFVSNGGVDIYSHKNDYIEKLDSLAITDFGTITDIQFFDDVLFVLRSTSPYVEMFRWKNGYLKKMTLRLAEAINANMSGFSFTNGVGQKISFGKDNGGRITCAIKFDADNLGIFVFEASGRIYECTNFYQPELTEINVFGALVARKNEKGYVVCSGKNTSLAFKVYLYSVDDGFEEISSAQISTDFDTNVLDYKVGANFIHTHRNSAPRNTIWYFDSQMRRIKPNEDANQAYMISPKGNFCMRSPSTTKNISFLFMREDGLPLIFANTLQQSYYTTWESCLMMGNSAVVVRTNEPHTLYLKLEDIGFKTVRGLPASTQLLITTKQSLVGYDKNNCKNYMMSLVLEIEGE